MNHNIGVIMDNKPGVLSRISVLLARRNFNIESITAGPMPGDETTRMTVVIQGDEYVAKQAEEEMLKLEDVIKIEHLKPSETTRREIVLIKIQVHKEQRSEIVDLAKIMDCKIVDISHTTLMIEHSDLPEKIDLLIDLLSGYEILDVARGGAIALKNGIEEPSASN
ncbi:MAG: acetolactate synthase small subunit [Clostridiales Family XIII bacterium]|jgi:acetolactate synthase-1/3 small subunit|nr:acetolactate synthase small subunit [Clostridiales Family XIII bacterium]